MVLTPAVSGVPAYAVGAFFSLAGTANPIPISKTQVNSKGFSMYHFEERQKSLRVYLIPKLSRIIIEY